MPFTIQVYLLFVLSFANLNALAQENWRSGDMIFRTGTETVSNIVIAADQGIYSHVGMLVLVDGAWKVIHATPEEIPGRGNKVVLDALDFFISSERALQYRIFRVESTNEQQQKAVEWVERQLGQPFTLLDPNGVYCTTLVWKAWLHAGVDLKVEFTLVEVPLMSNTQILLPSGLINSPLVRPVDL